MSKQKSVFVTAIMAIMLAVITFASYRLSMPVFIVLVSILSAVGFAFSSIMFCKWLQKPSECDEEAIEPPLIAANVDGEEFSATYEQIRQEVKGGL